MSKNVHTRTEPEKITVTYSSGEKEMWSHGQCGHMTVVSEKQHCKEFEEETVFNSMIKK